ncbi:hypothetical protein Bcep1808_3986 [Burkholderia vietnamiensis G4]|uniref:Uncharacterized protein n=1 Tax=Burkholderia vietnamiensis (strain G4 / LMG 22486) TaxID=269482 RepID=A4JL14_BURVG|nr:hypothetical protein Bcep1808_3986 [Burkholderia vietnamiensis G4]
MENVFPSIGRRSGRCQSGISMSHLKFDRSKRDDRFAKCTSIVFRDARAVKRGRDGARARGCASQRSAGNCAADRLKSSDVCRSRSAVCYDTMPSRNRCLNGGFGCAYRRPRWSAAWPAA